MSGAPHSGRGRSGAGSVGHRAPRPPPGDSVARHVRQWSGIPNAEVASDAALLRRVLLALRPEIGEQPRARWSLVSGVLPHGCGVSRAICVALGIDPDEQVAAPPTPEWLLELCPDLGEEP